MDWSNCARSGFFCAGFPATGTGANDNTMTGVADPGLTNQAKTYKLMLGNPNKGSTT